MKKNKKYLKNKKKNGPELFSPPKKNPKKVFKPIFFSF